VGQFGLFAAKKIPPLTYLLDYLGEVHCDDRPSSDYDLSLYRTPDCLTSVGVDASAMGNEGRFVNDYRGIRTRPNAQFEERRVDGGELKMTIWTCSEAIKKGDEILASTGMYLNTPLLTVLDPQVSYGKSWWSHRRLQEPSSP
jgi:SET domain-containing protein